MKKYGMVIDLKRCFGCRACAAACKTENAVQSGNYWLFVLEYEQGKYPNVRRNFVPMNCMHCEDPPCLKACPEKAIYKNEYGVVLFDYQKCKGRRYCIAACPYGVINYIEKEKTFYPVNNPDKGPTPYEKLPVQATHPLHRKRAKIAEKCILCWHRLEKAIKDGKKPGTDYDTSPACIPVCPANARFFGDLNDPNSEVSQLIAKKRATQLKKEFGTRPQVYYII
ncbi:MAG: 4Fe-4S dicluster domain-containing protein [Thermodesulfobacteriota bacterium]